MASGICSINSIHRISMRRPTMAQSVSSSSSSSSDTPLRLADVAKQHGLGVHVDNWREDQHPIRQYLPMQHIIGSLKRDRDEYVSFFDPGPTSVSLNDIRRHSSLAGASPRSEDSFLQALRSTKRRRTSTTSQAWSTSTTNSDPDRRFSWQATDHRSKDISSSALPGLNQILSQATITANERDVFSEYAPKHLEDPNVLMQEVLQLREQMGDEEDAREEHELQDECASTFTTLPVIPTEQEEEIRQAFKSFIDQSGGHNFVVET